MFCLFTFCNRKTTEINTLSLNKSDKRALQKNSFWPSALGFTALKSHCRLKTRHTVLAATEHRLQLADWRMDRSRLHKAPNLHYPSLSPDPLCFATIRQLSCPSKSISVHWQLQRLLPMPLSARRLVLSPSWGWGVGLSRYVVVCVFVCVYMRNGWMIDESGC